MYSSMKRVIGFRPVLLTLVMALALVATLVESLGASGTPPITPIRNVAEFEPSEAVMIRYPLFIPYTLIKEMALDTTVLTIVLDGAEEALARNEYGREGINLANCTFLHTPTESHWTRDCGPWFLFDGNAQFGVIDNPYPFNEPGCDAIPTVYAMAEGLSVYDTGLKHEGGNWMTDGQGTAISMNWVYKCNPTMTHQQVKDIARDFMGIDTYHVMPDHASFLHVDCMAKYLSPDTIMVGEVPSGHANYNALEDAVNYFEDQISCYGTPYKIVRVFNPDLPYTNSTILNHKVLVPLIGSPHDAAAIAAYEAAMPGYKVCGITYNKWNQYDALHCRTKELHDRDMLYIHHLPLLDRPAGAQGFPVEAEIIAYSGQAFTNGTPEVSWSVGSGWNSLAMSPTGGDMYMAYLPDQLEGTTVQYYVHAEDGSGRSENHPYIGEADAHTFTVNTLGIDRNALSAGEGGVINFHLNGGLGMAGRNYYILGSVTGTLPGLTLPGGKTLPLNWDAFTDMSIVMANGPSLVNFHGVLNGSGMATAQLDTLGPLPREAEGMTLYFACLVDWPFDFVSNAVSIEILE